MSNNGHKLYTEFWRCSIKNSEFLPHGYTAFRKDHTNRWGGVLQTVKDKFICEQISFISRTIIVAMKIQTYKHPLIVAAFYGPAKYSKEQYKTLYMKIFLRV